MTTVKANLEALKDLKERSANAEAGTYFPTAAEIVGGCSVFGGDAHRDVAKWREILLARSNANGANAEVAAHLDHYLLTRDPVDLHGLYEKVASVMLGDPDDALRAAVYDLGTRPYSREASSCLEAACTGGLSRCWLAGWKVANYGPERIFSMDAEAQLDRLHRGSEECFGETMNRAVVHAALQLAAGRSTWAHDRERFEAWHGDLLWNPAAEQVEVADEVVPEAAAPADGVIVIEKPGGKTTSDTRRLWDTFEGVAAVPLAPSRFRDPTVAKRLTEEWPHAADLIAMILSDLVVDAPIRFRPTLVVGKPGTGKTSLLQAVAKELGVASTVFPCGSSADNSFGGTPSRWSSACASTPLEAIRQSKIPNVVVILDELEKGPRNGSYGSIADTLLPMLEGHTARVYFEAGLNATSDLSHVSYLATANSLDLPAPIRDRFRVLRMPDPTNEHLPVLCRRIVCSIAAERGQHGLIPPLAPDELEVVERAWSGGSLRRLHRAVETTLEVRERMAVRQ